MINTSIKIAVVSNLILFTACNTVQQKETNVATPARSVPVQPVKDTVLFANVKFDSKWDLSCGMPITAGLEDTAHYKGKIYGFCSAACKADFLKDPAAAIKSKK